MAAICNNDMHWITLSHTLSQSYSLAAALFSITTLKPLTTNDINKDPPPNSLVAILLNNCPEWIISDYALSTHSLVSIPIHASFNPIQTTYILSHSQASVIITSPSSLVSLVNNLHQTHLKLIVLVGDPDQINNVILSTKDITEQLGITVHPFNHLIQMGSSLKHNPILPDPNHIITISYTSGTTGNPKGVLIKHKSIVASAMGFLDTIPKHLISFTEKDRHVSYLPLSHMLERVIVLTLGAVGVKIVFYSGKIENIVDDIRLVNPTFLPTVPRLLVKIRERVMQTVNARGVVVRSLFWIAFWFKKRLLDAGIVSNQTIWDTIVFHRVTSKFGKNLRGFVTGSAPVDPDVLVWYRVVFGVPVIEGYGLTESCAAGTVTHVHDVRKSVYGSHVGYPFKGVSVKLRSVDELGYHVTDTPYPRGEILLKGDTIMQGYYKDAVKTMETITGDGWLCTGDVGMVLPNRCLKLVDRVGSIFKLSQGEFVVPERVEGVIVGCAWIDQCVVWGNCTESTLVCVCVLNRDQMKEYTIANGLVSSPSDSVHDSVYEKICESAHVKQIVLDDIMNICRSHRLMGYEIPRHVVCDWKEWTIDTGLVTPTMKIRRRDVVKKYEREIRMCYEKK